MLFVSAMLLYIAIQLNAPTLLIVLGVVSVSVQTLNAVLQFLTGFIKSFNKSCDKS